MYFKGDRQDVSLERDHFYYLIRNQGLLKYLKISMAEKVEMGSPKKHYGGKKVLTPEHKNVDKTMQIKILIKIKKFSGLAYRF